MESFGAVQNEDPTTLEVIIKIGLFLLKVLWAIIKATYRLFVSVPKKSVQGEIVLITGGGSGFGRELALQYAAEGATVVSWDINEKGNLGTIKEIERLDYPKAYSYLCDVTNRSQVLYTAKKVQKDVGDVTILVNNAGIMPCRPFLDQTSDEIERTINTNLMSHFWTLQAFLPAMKKSNHGHVVAICSAAALVGLQYIVPYCTSKHAIRGLMEALGRELLFDNPKCQIKTTTIYPTMAKTGLVDVRRIKSQLPSLIPILDAKRVAQQTISAQRRDLQELSIPGHVLSMLLFARIFPVSVMNYLMDLLNAYIESDLK